MFAEDAVVREVGNPLEARGRAAIRARAATLLAAFPDFHLERRELLVDAPDGLVVEDVHLSDLAGLFAQLGG